MGLAIAVLNQIGMKALRSDDRIRKIVEIPELRLIRPVQGTHKNAATSPTWGIERLRIPDVWEKGLYGDGVLIGHIDTGIDVGHPTLTGACSEFAEFDFNGNEVPHAKPHESDMEDAHGTHTAGIIAGRPFNGTAIGVAPKAGLASAIVIEGGEVIDRIIGGMEWLLAKNVKIMNASLGLPGYTAAFHEIIDALRDAGVLPVIAIGNDGPNTYRSPGNYSNVLSIGAIDSNDDVAIFSGNGNCKPDDEIAPDLVAPGVDVVSAFLNGKYEPQSGTSMAAAHIAGLAAILLQAKPTASATDIERAILRSCNRPGSMPTSRANRGVPDAVDALNNL